MMAGPYAEEEDEPSDAAAGSDGGDRVGGDEAEYADDLSKIVNDRIRAS